MTRKPAAAVVGFDATIGLGSNIGDKAANIDRAIALLTLDGSGGGSVRLVKASRKYRSAPWGVTDQDWFVNACISVATDLSAHELLARCQHIENEMGRVRRQKWGPRLIDVDILTYRDQIIAEPDLKVPHPLIAERSFVLMPLMDVAPETRINGKSLDALIDALGASDTVPL
jgi:2-amino-4-hydroxy-6-hydroxymethyldihydropteridine diphosphokinase